VQDMLETLFAHGQRNSLIIYICCCQRTAGLCHTAVSECKYQRGPTSRRLCGGMRVAMPTAMPDVPLTSSCGTRAGSTSGSSCM